MRTQLNCRVAVLLLVVAAAATVATAQTPADFGYGRIEALGSRPLLIILTEYQGSPALRSADPVPDAKAYFERLAFNPFGSPSIPSLTTYFQEISNGRFYWTSGGVVGPYGFNASDIGVDKDGKLTRVNRALNAAANDVDFGQFDQDGDGVVRTNELGVLIIDNYVTDGTSFSYYGANRFSDPPCFKPDGKQIELCLKAANAGHYASFMTIAHELLHSVGKDNCLNGNNDCALDVYGGTGGMNDHFSTMAATVDAPAFDAWHLDPWHKIQYGWVEPLLYDMHVPQTISLGAANAIQNDQPVILYDPYGLDEYFILEYRTNQTLDKGGYDADIYGSGLVVWHIKVDADKVPIVTQSSTEPGKMDRLVLMLGSPKMTRGTPGAWTPAKSSIFGTDSYALPYNLQWLYGSDTGVRIRIGLPSADLRRLTVSWGPFYEQLQPEKKKILSYSQLWRMGEIGQFDDQDSYIPLDLFNTVPTGYTHVVADQAGIFYYDQSTGKAMLASIEASGAHKVLATFPIGYFGAGWTHIVSHRGYLFFYAAHNGMAGIGTLSPSGYREYKAYPAGSFSTGWTHIVSTSGGLLFYAAGSGMGAVGGWEYVYASCGTFCFPTVVEVRYRTLSWYAPGSFSTGWSSIAETNDGVAFYRKTDGLQVMADILSNGKVSTRMHSFQRLNSGYTHVVSFGQHILFYASETGRTGVAEIVKADPWVYSGAVGTLNMLQEWDWFLASGWSHVIASADPKAVN